MKIMERVSIYSNISQIQQHKQITMQHLKCGTETIAIEVQAKWLQELKNSIL